MLGVLGPAAAIAAVLGGCSGFDDTYCDQGNCAFTREEWARVQGLANLPPPPADLSNKYFDNPAAAKLGQAFYFDPHFSGAATLVDSIGRSVPYARASKGQQIGISCATCHDPANGGTDHSSNPGNVSVGAGWYDVNAQPTINSAQYRLVYWNMRTDSLWAQAFVVTESGFSMNGNRLKIARWIAAKYADQYQAVFGKPPLPGAANDPPDGFAENGECRPSATARCPPQCFSRTDVNTSSVACFSRFPPSGKPGDGKCDFASKPDEPYHDAFDCMDPADQPEITRTGVNYGKAIAAYEYLLVSNDSDFDRFVAAGPKSNILSDAAIRGLKLFVGKASCIDCHNTPLLSDQQFHDVGIEQIGPQVPEVTDCVAGGKCDCSTKAGSNCLPWGVFNGFEILKSSKLRRDSTWSDDQMDTSRAEFYALAPTDEMKGSWRTPSLRDVALTAPYMHDGIYRTLREVVHHYNIADVGPQSVGAPSVRLHPLHLSADEEQDLVSFLETLTGAPLPRALVTPP